MNFAPPAPELWSTEHEEHIRARGSAYCRAEDSALVRPCPPWREPDVPPAVPPRGPVRTHDSASCFFCIVLDARAMTLFSTAGVGDDRGR